MQMQIICKKEESLKNKTIKILILLILLIFSTSCNNENTKDKEIIYTSIYPINFITKRIVGDNMEVRNIIPVGVESHGWEPKLKDIADISDAKLVLINGLSME